MLSVILTIGLTLPPADSRGAETAFPTYPAIKDNVDFWYNIYTRYNTNQAVVHNKNDLTKIYHVAPVIDYRLPGAHRINRIFLKKLKLKYRKILKHLAVGYPPATAEERKINALFTSQQDLKKAAESVRIQIGQKNRFKDGVIRSGAYLPEIKSIFRSLNLPEELAYLPHVESSFNPKAYSKYGASGIWQFTRGTGKQYLTINYMIDERRDPIIASRAAARFLKDNYTALKSWPLAVTAYNYGTAGMQRARGEHGNYEDIFKHYNKGRFKFASKNFYPEFLAALKAAKKFEQDLSLIRHTPRTAISIQLPGYVPAIDIISHFNIDFAKLKEYNPSLLSPIYKGQKHIPKDFMVMLPDTMAIKNAIKSIPDDIFLTSQKKNHFYTVQPGDTAGGIAIKHSVSLVNLAKVNSLNRQAMVYIGQRLRIPAPPVIRHSRPAKNKRSKYIVLADSKKRIPTKK